MSDQKPTYEELEVENRELKNEVELLKFQIAKLKANYFNRLDGDTAL